MKGCLTTVPKSYFVSLPHWWLRGLKDKGPANLKSSLFSAHCGCPCLTWWLGARVFSCWLQEEDAGPVWMRCAFSLCPPQSLWFATALFDIRSQLFALLAKLVARLKKKKSHLLPEEIRPTVLLTVPFWVGYDKLNSLTLVAIQKMFCLWYSDWFGVLAINDCIFK